MIHWLLSLPFLKKRPAPQAPKKIGYFGAVVIDFLHRINVFEGKTTASAVALLQSGQYRIYIVVYRPSTMVARHDFECVRSSIESILPSPERVRSE